MTELKFSVSKIITIVTAAIFAAVASVLLQELILGDVHVAITGGITGAVVGGIVPTILSRKPSDEEE